MSPIKYFLGKALQFVGLMTITAVVFMFFSQMKMEPLLYWSLLGIIEFYLGTFLLGREDS
jgi:hypothetical protein